MHTTIDYSTHADESAKRQAAIADIKEYLGEERFNYVSGEFSKFGKEAMPIETMEGYLMLAGISGYPVIAWHHFIFEPDADGFNYYERMQFS